MRTFARAHVECEKAFSHGYVEEEQNGDRVCTELSVICVRFDTVRRGRCLLCAARRTVKGSAG